MRDKSCSTPLERVESEMLAVQARLQGVEATVAGVVRVGAPDGFGVGFLASRLTVFADRYLDLTIQLVPTHRGFAIAPRGRPRHHGRPPREGTPCRPQTR